MNRFERCAVFVGALVLTFGTGAGVAAAQPDLVLDPDFAQPKTTVAATGTLFDECAVIEAQSATAE